jgi:hypothetical protein
MYPSIVDRKQCDPADCPQNKQHISVDTTPQGTSLSRQRLHAEVNSSLAPYKGPQCIERRDSRAGHMINALSGGTLSLPTHLGAAREPRFEVRDQNTPEAQRTAGAKYTFLKHPATVSRTSISSSPPPKIFTPTNASSSGQSFSDLSIASLPVQETYHLFNVADFTGGEIPQAQANAPHHFPANGTHHLYHSSATLGYFIGGDNLSTNSTSPDINSQMHSYVDFESFIHSEGFLSLDQSGSDVYGLGTADDNCHPHTSINPRRLNKTPFAEPLASSQNWTATFGSSPNKDASGKQKSHDEDQAALILDTNLSSPITTARYGGSYYPGVEGNNRPARVCAAPIKTGTTRSLSGRSTYSCNTRSSSVSGESTNAPDGGDWHGAHSSRLRKIDPSDTTQRPSSSDRDSFHNRREGYSDDVQAVSSRIRQRHTFSFGYKGRPLPTHRNTFSKKGYMEQDQNVDHLTSELGLVHI